MKIEDGKYIILEIIPTNYKNKNGTIIQLSALKIDSLKLLDRFDYRLCDESLPIKEMKSWIDYDKEYFTYVDSEDDILKAFSNFIDDYPLLIINNGYTKDFLNKLPNDIYSILDYLNIQYSDQVIDEIMNKYNLQPSNHVVDLLYEALLMEY